MENEIEYIYPATSLQQGFIYHALSQPEDDAYRIQILIDYHSALDVDLYIKAWEYCISQYPILRTAFNWDESIIQLVCKYGKLNYQVHDLTHLHSTEERDEAIKAIQIADRKKNFDLSQPTLLRLHIIKQSESFYTVLKNVHHSIADGWSESVLSSSLHEYYKQLKENKVPVVKVDTAYIESQEYITDNSDRIQEYWKNVLINVENANDISALLSKPIDLLNYKHIEHFVSVEVAIGKDAYHQMKAFAKREGITINVVVQFAWHKLLQVYSNRSKTIVGTTVSGRDLPVEGIEESVGLYINTLPLIIDWENGKTILQQLHEIQQKITELNTHSFANLAKLQKHGERIFHSLFAYENFPASKNDNDNLNVSVRSFIEKVDYPLGVSVYETPDALIIKLTYDNDYLTVDKAQGHLTKIESILQQILEEPDKIHNQIILLSKEEYKKIIFDWNETDKDFSNGKTVVELFKKQVALAPGKIAIAYQSNETSYQKLDEQSDLLANYIKQNYQLQNNKFIGIMLDRSDQMLVAILAVLKAGGAYVPIDPKNLLARKKYILEDASVDILISQSDYIFDLEFYTGNLFAIDIQLDTIDKSVDSTLPLIHPSDVAYVIYTSGTTGNPKGVMITHKAVVNYINNVSEVLLPTVNHVDFSTNISFDLTITTTICSLVLGKKIVVYEGELSNAEAYVQHLVNNKIDFIKSTPSLLSNLPADYFNNYTIKQAFIGGEKLEDFQLTHITKYVDVLIDEYGPTEATVGTTYIKKNKVINKGIGKPYFNYRAYVLNAFTIPGHVPVPVPVGVIGELYIGGEGLAKGYLNRLELTSERFIENPFISESDILKQYTKLYKTGDLVRWLPDGNLEFIGRNDNQIKIRGYRVELGEIEHAFSYIEAIQQACVLSKKRSDGSKYLVAYYVLNNENERIDQAVILEKLSKLLPEYMVPSLLVGMERFPLTTNGKLDRDVLPDPDFTSSEEYIAPANELEDLLCKIWQEVLNLEKIGITDNFFRIGGDSILSIQVSSRIRQAGYGCQVKDIFECKTISKLALHLSSEGASLSIRTEQGILSGELDFLPIQQFFISNVDKSLIKNPHHYNHSFLIRVPVLDVIKLAAILDELVSYHDVLRIHYKKENGKWEQFYGSSIAYPPLKQLDVSSYSATELNDILTQWQSSFDLEKGPLFQAGYLHGYPDGSARIYFALHHLIIDSVSWRILADDIKQLYTGKNLPEKGSSYRQWVEIVKGYTQTHTSESSYWELQLRDIPSYEKSACKEEYVTAVEIDKDITKILLNEASKAYHTEVNDLLLTAVAYALKDLNGSYVQGLSLDGHGRESIDSSIDHSHTVGWFTSLFPIRLELKDTVSESIQSIKEYLRSIPNKGIGFGAFACSDEHSYSFNDLSPISFNYLGQFDTQEGDWQIVLENSGNSIHGSNEDNTLLNVIGIVSNGTLEFSIISKLSILLTQQFSDSLKIQLTRIINHCSDKISKKELSHTPSDFAFVHIHQKLLNKLEHTAKENANEIIQLYAANSLQQGFIYHALSQPADDAYCVQVLFNYHESLDLFLYIKSWEYCIAQYPILRTAFNWEEEIIQVIYKYSKLEYYFHDISHLTSQQERDAEMNMIQQEDRKQGFDLSKPSLFRLHIIKQQEALYTILKTEHHSIADGWSGPVLLNSVHDYYKQLKNNQIPVLKEDIAYLETQEYIAKNKRTVHSYWQKALNEIDAANDITDLLSKPIDLSYKKIEQVSNTSIEIVGDAYNELKNFVVEKGLTTNVLLQFIWHKLLQVYSRSLKTIVGTTISGRDLPIHNIESSVGLYINTLPLIVDWDNDNSIVDQLNQIQQKITEVNTHSFVELATLQKDGERLFHSLFDYANYPAPKDDDSTKVDLIGSIEKVDYPLSVQAYEYNNSLIVILQHDESILSQEKASHHLETLKTIISQVIKESSKSHRELSLIQPEEYKKIVHDWNLTDKTYSKDRTIHDLFEEQARKTPDAIALVYENVTLSYKELNEKSNQLARYIESEYKTRTKKSISADTLIALYLDKSLEIIIGILAVMKVGGAYVPIDTNYPQERVDFILHDTNTDIILVQKHVLKKSNLQLPEGKILNIDLTEHLYEKEYRTNLAQQVKGSDLAYVIYTSGTTGKPKGVMIEHRAVLSLVFNDYIKTKGSDIFAFFSSPAFDAATFEIFTPLLNGCKLIIPKDFNDLVSDINNFKSFIEVNQISSLWLTKTLFDNLYYLDNCLFENLNYLIIGGEALDKNTVNKLIASSGKPKNFLNGYGPTESTTFSCVYELTHSIASNNVPIGKPINNRKTFILDSNKSPVPIGVVGELYIAGAGLARGYLNNIVLTNERFVLNPFATDSDKTNGYDRLYKTGDTVKWLSDGNIEYIGRNDEQVKIHGFRIELNEIEYRLTQIKGIQQAYVIVKEQKIAGGTDKQLIAFYMLNALNEDLTSVSIESQLSKVLPAYMIPKAFIKLDALPTTNNGKLNKQALSALDISLSTVYIAPANELEIKLSEIWKEVLGINRVGTTDNFFSIGGSSITAIQLVNKMNKVLDNHLKIADVFRYKTIQQILAASQTNYESKWMKPYYTVYDPSLTNLIFIHPGNAGCEVYQEVADQLGETFNCIGIDNYNIHNEEKISSLNKLAHLYLLELEQFQKLSKPVTLIGWSLGGVIALEMAAILEIRGVKNIHVVLLDTWLSDEISNGWIKKIDMDAHIQDFRNYSLSIGQEKQYVERVIAALPTEVKLNNTAISKRLKYTLVTLFKALKEDKRITNKIFESLYKHSMTKPDNNVRQVADHVKIINLDCHHGSILELNTNFLSNYLKAQLSESKSEGRLVTEMVGDIKI